MDNKLYLTEEYESILDSYIFKIPLYTQFNLLEIGSITNPKFSDIITEGLTYNDQTFYFLTNFLIQNGFAEICGIQNIILTERGRTLVKLGSFRKYLNYLELIETGNKRTLWKKKNWLFIEILKILIPLIAGIFIGVKYKN